MIPMRKNLIDIPDGINYLVGNTNILQNMTFVPAKKPFSEDVLNFLNDVSRNLMTDKRSQQFSDIITFAFWIRKSSILKLAERFDRHTGNFVTGRGVVFHVAPSNVPVNYAYSMVSGLITGNANVVRVPSKDFPQIKIINDAISESLSGSSYASLCSYICLIRYGREREINDYLSNLCDIRVIWGGDDTIKDIRRSPLRSRAGEITFADRYSLAVIDSDAYIALTNKPRVAAAFYNDTYFSDQNACTSPRIVVWTGGKIYNAKAIFWAELHKLLSSKYSFQPIQAVNKFTSACLLAASIPGVTIEPESDNLIVRCKLDVLPDDLMEKKDNSGYFFEYDCKDLRDIQPLCDDSRCQTVAYIGDPDMLSPILETIPKGIDRIVPMGRTMDFDLIWDGYNLYDRLTRTTAIIQ